MYTSMSSLFCLEKKMAVLGDNIANVSTTGFRGSRVSFEDVLSQATGTGGVRLNPAGSTSDFSREGAAESSHIATNMAISGDGFFILRDSEDTSSTYYTRAGEFSFDSEGYLVNPGGHIVQGYEFSDQGTEGGTPADIQLNLTTPAATVDNPDPAPRLVSPPSASTRLTLISNIDARSGDNSRVDFLVVGMELKLTLRIMNSGQSIIYMTAQAIRIQSRSIMTKPTRTISGNI